MNEQWVLFVPNTTATTSTNWSGYVATTQNDSVTYVTGTWTVPTVTATSGVTNSSAWAWVGIDGWGNHTVEQTGTAQRSTTACPPTTPGGRCGRPTALQGLAGGSSRLSPP